MLVGGKCRIPPEKSGFRRVEFEPCRKAFLHEVRELLILIAADRVPGAVRERQPFGTGRGLPFTTGLMHFYSSGLTRPSGL
jgi:hypothetical protein